MLQFKQRIAACIFILVLGLGEMYVSIRNMEISKTSSSSGVLTSGFIIFGGIVFTVTSIVLYKKEKNKIGLDTDEEKDSFDINKMDDL